MKSKIIFELKLNLKDSLIAYEKSDYDICYEDAVLYIKRGSKESKIVESSFCYGFGAEMYYRIYNVNNYSENFADSLKDFYNSLNYNYEKICAINNSELDFEDDYVFVNGKSSNKFTPLFLFKNHNGYFLLYVELWRKVETKKCELKILKEYKIDEEMFAEWKKLISVEWEKRAIIEGEKMSNKKQSREEWQKYFEFMRNENVNN